MTVKPASAAVIAEAAAILKAGGLIGLPTETVYGLAADALNGAAVARIFAAKARPRFNPLILHVPHRDAAEAHVLLPPLGRRLADAFWPGPLTLVAPRRPDSPVSLLAAAGLDTLAVRAPGHPVAQAVLRGFGGPLAAPSANRSGRLSPTRAEHVAAEFGEALDLIVDGGPCAVGIESAIVSVADERATLLRPGGVPRAALEAVAGPLAAPSDALPDAPQSPGRLASHYAPRARLRLDAAAPRPGEAFLAFGPDDAHAAANLSPRGDLAEAAARLFELLRALDATGVEVIAVAPIPAEGLGEAIRDRLARAAAPRP